MAATTKTWSDNNPPTLNDADLNGFKLENNNLITGSGQVLSDVDNQQTQKAISIYSSGGDFYTDSGVADAYVLSVIGSKVAPPSYFVGMRIRFISGNSNTGASTVNVDSLGVKNLIGDITGASLAANQVQTVGIAEAYYDGTSFRLITAGRPISGSFTTASIATGSLDVTIAHNAGTDNMNFGFKLSSSVNNSSVDIISIDAGGFRVSQRAMTNLSTISSPSTPAAGNLTFRIQNNDASAQTVTIHWWITPR